MSILKGQIETHEGDILFPKTSFDMIEGVPNLSAPNLLINSDFQCGIINQQNQTTTAGANGFVRYVCDMWNTNGDIDVTVDDGFLKCVNRDVNKQWVRQYLMYELKQGKKYTFTINVDGQVKSHVFTAGTPVDNDVMYYQPKDSSPERIGITIAGKATSKVYYAKLEEGEIYTGMPVFDWWHEFNLCERELKRIPTVLVGYGFGGYVYTVIPNVGNMQRMPSVRIEKGINDGKIYLSNDLTTPEFIKYESTATIDIVLGHLKWSNAGAWDGYKINGFINAKAVYLDARMY